MKIPDCYNTRELKYRDGDNIKIMTSENNEISIEKLEAFLNKAKDVGMDKVKFKGDRDNAFLIWSIWTQETDEEHEAKIKKQEEEEKNCVRRVLSMEYNQLQRSRKCFEGTYESQKLERAIRSLHRRPEDITQEDIDEIEEIYQDMLKTGNDGFEK